MDEYIYPTRQLNNEEFLKEMALERRNLVFSPNINEYIYPTRQLNNEEFLKENVNFMVI